MGTPEYVGKLLPHEWCSLEERTVQALWGAKREAASMWWMPAWLGSYWVTVLKDQVITWVWHLLWVKARTGRLCQSNEW